MAGRGTATKGRRIPLLPEAQVKAKGSSTVYVCGGRPLRFGDHILTEGVEVPGAASWPRLEAWISARRVRPVQPGEEYVPYAAFEAEQMRIAKEEREKARLAMLEEAYAEYDRREAEALAAKEQAPTEE